MTGSTAQASHFWQRIAPLRFDKQAGVLRVLDQTCLPFTELIVDLTDLESSCEAIVSMRVRGAPLVGLCAAFGLVLGIREDASASGLDSAIEKLLATRPTAVNLAWAVQLVAQAARAVPITQRYSTALAKAVELQALEENCCERIASHGLTVIEEIRQRHRAHDRDLQILTHCNAGALATGAWGTATAPIYRAAAAGIPLHVWVDETRPRNQGARLTSWELNQAGIPCTLIADNAAGALMQHGEVDLCLVGSDRTTAHGDVCNKIGTYQKALAARDNAVPFYVALPSSTIDWDLEDGIAEIPIEERDAAELLEAEGIDEAGKLRKLKITAPDIAARNIAFDVTPARLISGGLLCELGLFTTGRAGMQRLHDALATNENTVQNLPI